jgi:GNAT superfamily N-acetyltransferase
MGYVIDDPNKVANAIRALATAGEGDYRNGHPVVLVGDAIKVYVQTSSFEVTVEFFERHALVAQFTLIEQPNCCGALVSTRTYVSAEYRGQGVAQKMMTLKEAIAKSFGYSSLVATVNMTDNLAEVHILEKSGWELGHTFTNKRTDHVVGYYFKNLEA